MANLSALLTLGYWSSWKGAGPLGTWRTNSISWYVANQLNTLRERPANDMKIIVGISAYISYGKWSKNKRIMLSINWKCTAVPHCIITFKVSYQILLSPLYVTIINQLTQTWPIWFLSQFKDGFNKTRCMILMSTQTGFVPRNSGPNTVMNIAARAITIFVRLMFVII